MRHGGSWRGALRAWRGWRASVGAAEVGNRRAVTAWSLLPFRRHACQRVRRRSVAGMAEGWRGGGGKGRMPRSRRGKGGQGERGGVWGKGEGMRTAESASTGAGRLGPPVAGPWRGPSAGGHGPVKKNSPTPGGAVKKNPPARREGVVKKNSPVDGGRVTKKSTTQDENAMHAFHLPHPESGEKRCGFLRRLPRAMPASRKNPQQNSQSFSPDTRRALRAPRPSGFQRRSPEQISGATLPLGDRRAPQGYAKSAPLRNAPNLSFRTAAGGGPPGQATWHTDPRKPCLSTTTSAVNKMRRLKPPCFLNDTPRRTMRHHAYQHPGGGGSGVSGGV